MAIEDKKILNWSEPKEGQEEEEQKNLEAEFFKDLKKRSEETPVPFIEKEFIEDPEELESELSDDGFNFLCSRCDFGTDSIREFQKHHCQEEPETVELEETYIPRRSGVSIASLGGIVGMAVSAIIVFSVAVPLIKDATNGVYANLTSTEGTVASLISVFVILGMIVAAAGMFGLM